MTLIALATVNAQAQTQPERAAVFEKTALKDTKPCVVGSSGEVTALVKNGVELSVNEDWDCDGVPDAYDNCVGMPNRDQLDSDHDGIGNVCEAASIIKTTGPSKARSRAKANETTDRQARAKNKKPQSHREHAKQTKPKANRRRR